MAPSRRLLDALLIRETKISLCDQQLTSKHLRCAYTRCLGGVARWSPASQRLSEHFVFTIQHICRSGRVRFLHEVPSTASAWKLEPNRRNRIEFRSFLGVGDSLSQLVWLYFQPGVKWGPLCGLCAFGARETRRDHTKKIESPHTLSIC